MKKYLILACILLQYAILIDKVWAADTQPFVNWGGTSYYFGNNYTGQVVGGSSSYDCILDSTATSQTYSINYYRSDYSEWYSSITGGLGIYNNTTTNTYSVFYDLCACNPDQSLPTFTNSGGSEVSSYFFNTSGWSDYLQSSNMSISTFPRNEATTYIDSVSDFFSENLSVNALLSEADMVGSILVNKFGIADEYDVNEFGSALNDFCAGLFGVDSFTSTGRITTLGPQESLVASGNYYWLVSGANEKHTIATFSAIETSVLQSASASDLIDLYNSNTGSTWTLYTEEELNTIFEVLPYDGDVSLGTGSTSNFKELLVYLFMPSYTGIEENYDEMLDGLGILYMPIDYIHCILGTVAGTYSDTMDLSWDDISVQGIEIDSSTFSFDPRNVIPDSIFLIFQYFAMFVVLCGLTIHTYRHLFSKNSDEGGSAI